MPYVLKDIAIKDETGIRYPENFAKKWILEYTKPGDTVFDPFAGFGTTLIAAQKLKRVGIGVEYDSKRAAFISKQLKAPTRVIHSDTRKLNEHDIPLCDFSLTSPPYMQYWHTENPLTNYGEKGSYSEYLEQLRDIYSQIKQIMKPDAIVILEVANISGDGRPITPLAWDIAAELSEILFFEREYIFCHTKTALPSAMGDHSYCLMFRNR